MVEGERALAQSPQLREHETTSGGATEHGGHALDLFYPGHPSSPYCFEWRDEVESKRIFVWWVKYVDTMRPCSVWRLDTRWTLVVEYYRSFKCVALSIHLDIYYMLKM
jgi:hypothetical protein